MAQPESGDTARKIAVMVNEVDKKRFDALCEDRTWPQWRMFQDLLEAWEHSAASRVRPRPETI